MRSKPTLVLTTCLAGLHYACLDSRIKQADYAFTCAKLSTANEAQPWAETVAIKLGIGCS